MNFNKHFDYTDINNFLPDNFTLANAEYYANKFNLPDGYEKILCAMSRVEFDDTDVENIKSEVFKAEQEHFLKLMKEFNERSLIGLEDLTINEKPSNNILISDNSINE